MDYISLIPHTRLTTMQINHLNRRVPHNQSNHSPPLQVEHPGAHTRRVLSNDSVQGLQRSLCLRQAQHPLPSERGSQRRSTLSPHTCSTSRPRWRCDCVNSFTYCGLYLLICICYKITTNLRPDHTPWIVEYHWIMINVWCSRTAPLWCPLWCCRREGRSSSRETTTSSYWSSLTPPR